MNSNVIINILEAEMRSRTPEDLPVRMENGKPIFRASSIGKCKRQLFYYLCGETPAPLPVESIHNFDRGHEHHTVLGDALEGLGIIEHQEETVLLDFGDFSITGHMDGHLAEAMSPEPVLIEFKSMNEFGFELTKKNGLDPHYLKQIHIYMKGMETTHFGRPAKSTIVIGDCKPNKMTPPIVYQFTSEKDGMERIMLGLDIEYQPAVFDGIVSEIRELLDDPDPDPLEPEIDTPTMQIATWECSFCPFAYTCRAGWKLVSKRGREVVSEYVRKQDWAVRLAKETK